MVKGKSRRRRKLWVFLVLAILVAVVLGVVATRKREDLVRVETEKVLRRDLTEKVLANGRIQPVLQVK
ncbi:MAG: efflux RND transporter periplasmic adaptor subunit, partial [Limisphaerales bacterium]